MKRRFIISILLFLVSACGGHKAPELIQRDVVKLQPAVYEAIANYSKASAEQKNAIMAEVRAAMLKLPKDQARRDRDIKAAVKARGDLPGLAEAIKAQVDAADPIAPQPVLQSKQASALPQAVYNAIAFYLSATIEQKNAIMIGVAAAMKGPKLQAARDAAIDAVVAKNGNYIALAKIIKAAVDKEDPIVPPPVGLKTEAVSGLPPAIYQVIVNHDGSSVSEKNAIMQGVRQAMAVLPKDQASRDAAIDDAVAANGGHADLLNLLKTAVDNADPIIPPIVLKTQAASGLAQAIYDAIALFAGPTIEEKNAIMTAVRAAMLVRPKVQATRDAALNDAVAANGGHAAMVNLIKTAVDNADPIIPPIVLKTQAASGLAPAIYDVIALFGGPTVAQKNAIMEAVRLAMAVRPKNRAVRDDALRAAVQDNGDHAALFLRIKTQVDIADPIAPRVPLKTHAESGLPLEVYRVIADYDAATKVHRNTIMVAVSRAMAVRPQAARDRAIRDAVNNNGRYAGLAELIKTVVDRTDPIPVPPPPPGVKSQAESGLPEPVYDVIANHATASPLEKNKIMEGVRLAMAALPKVQSLRNADISIAVRDNGNHKDLSAALIEAIDNADPIVPKVQRDFLNLLADFKDLPTIWETIRDATGNEMRMEVPEPGALADWQLSVRELIPKHIAAYADYQAWFYDYHDLITKMSSLGQPDLERIFSNQAINWYRAALAAEELIGEAAANQAIADFVNEIKVFNNSAQWRKDIYVKLDALIKNYKPDLVAAAKLSRLIDDKVKNNELSEDFKNRISAAAMPFMLVGKYKTELTDFLATFKAGKDWHAYVDPRITKLKNLGKNAVADELVAKFEAAAAGGPKDVLEKAAQALADFKIDFAKFYNLGTETLVNKSHKVDFRTLEMALKDQAEAIEAFKATMGAGWENDQKISLAKRREYLAIMFLRYSAEHIDVIVNELKELESKGQAGILSKLDPTYKNLPVEEDTSLISLMLKDLKSEIEAPKYLNFTDIKARMKKQQEDIKASFDVLEPKIKSQKLKDTFGHWKDKFLKITETYHISM